MTTIAHAVKQPQYSAKTVRLTTAQALVRFLCAQSVEDFDGNITPLCGGIWGIFGHGNVAGLSEALWNYREALPYFRGQNEQAMAHAAIAFAKAHRARRIMGVTTSIGPGSTNLVTAAALAHINRLPVLFLPGDIFASRRPDPVLQQLEDERLPIASVNDTFIPVSRYFDRLMRPEQLLHSLPHAIETLIHPALRGPVTLALPQDVQTEAFDYPSAFFTPKIHPVIRPRPDKRQLSRSLSLLLQSKRPLAIVGGGVHYSGAEALLKNFIETHGIAFAETQAGKGALPSNHPYNLGAIGVTGTSAANALAEQADLIIAIGTRLSDFTTASGSLFAAAPLIAINISPFDAVKYHAEPLAGDALACLEELSASALSYQTSPQYRLDVSKLKQIWSEAHEKETAPCSTGLPTDAQVLKVVNTIAEPKDVVVSAAGGLPGELHKHWQVRSPLSYHLEYGYSCMGYEIAGGLGVKMAHPDREIYVLVGDGSYLMMHTELLTSIQLGLKINVVLLDNGGFGCIHRLQKNCGVPPFGNLFHSKEMDFVKNAASYGCHSSKAENLEDLSRILIENRSRGETCVTVIHTDPHLGSPGYAWWNVAIAAESGIETVQQARIDYMNQIQRTYGAHS